MRSTFKILFYIKKNAIKSNGKAPVMARITLNGEIAQFSVKCDVDPAEWNPKAGKATGRSASAIKLNGLLDNFRANLTQHSTTPTEISYKNFTGFRLGILCWRIVFII